MEQYRFERLNPQHYKDLIYISESAFGIKPDINYFIAKNNTEAFGEPNLGYIAYHIETNEPSAFYGVYSYPFVFNEKKYFVVQSGDTMTHKNHTGKGLFTLLAKMTYSLAEEKGAEMVFGFPNDNSYPGFVKKLDWIHRDNISVYKLKVKTIPLLKIAKKIQIFKLIYKPYLNLVNLFFKARSINFQNSVIEENNGGIDHNLNFFSYKKFNGNYNACINKTHVWLKPDGFLFIGDIERNTEMDLKNVIHGIKNYARLIGADVIQFGFSPGSYWNSIFSSYFKAEKGAAFGYLLFKKEFPIEHFEYSLADLDTF